MADTHKNANYRVTELRLSKTIKNSTITTLLCLATACQNQTFKPPAPQIDTSPVDCGYKWFQTGRSPYTAVTCEVPRGEDMKTTMVTLATEQAWSIARQRCPEVCPPRTLQDTSEWQDNYPDGVCRKGQVFYHARVFFQCYRPN